MALAAVAAISVDTLFKVSKAHQHSEEYISELSSLSTELYSLSWIAVESDGGQSPRVRPYRQVQQRLDDKLSQLKALAVTEPSLPALLADLQDFRTKASDALGNNFSVPARERFWMLNTLTPAYAHLQALFQQTESEAEASARTWELAADIGAAVSLIGEALLISFFFAQAQRTKRKAEAQVANEVHRNSERLRALFRNATDLILIVDETGTMRYHSPSAHYIWSYSDDCLDDQPLQTLIFPGDEQPMQDALAEALAQPGLYCHAELRLRRADGACRHAEITLNNLLAHHAVGGIVLTIRDVTERKHSEAELARLAFTDALTGLPNRSLFMDRLGQALNRSRLHQTPVTLMFLDLDNFKLVNDSLGHQVGDELLLAVAQRVGACVNREDTVARLGGDEFTIMLEGRSAADACAVAGRIAVDLRQPLHLDGQELFLTFSIGISSCEDGSDTPDTLLRKADVAMYQAKNSGKAGYALFDSGMNTRTVARLLLESDLHRALDRSELRLHFQPILDLAAGEITQVEALVRWQHPDRGLIMPAEFIPLAEETGLIGRIDHWVLTNACRQIRALQEADPERPPLTVCVNLSARKLLQNGLTAEVADVLAETGLAPEHLVLEVTETTMLQDMAAAGRILRQLKALGIRVAIDDFGTGYSSLAYLGKLPVDVIKIDRSFVEQIGEDPTSTAILQAVAALARTLNLTLTGEGVETATQREHLEQLGCEHGQGYYFARPMPQEELQALLQRTAV
jgi:diguanylate cyclase (GGDEF)-like protein/PAS domain S-box-containing protein